MFAALMMGHHFSIFGLLKRCQGLGRLLVPREYLLTDVDQP
jgi:hypothetical protein